MKTDNRNTLCVVDVETTGLIAGYHEVIEIAVVILDEHLQPTDKVFNRRCRPLHPERYSKEAQRVNGITASKSMTFADPFDIRDEFDDFYLEHVREKKKFAPMGHNYAFDQAMLKAFFGTYDAEDGETNLMYDDYFYHRYRDTMINAEYINDLAEINGQIKVPFPKVSLKYVCNILQIENPRAHSALSDALATVACYNKMTNWYLHGLPITFGTADAI